MNMRIDDEIKQKREPMTFESLRGRLKEIAGLCWGLSIDLANEIEEREKVVSECDALKQELEGLRRECSRYAKATGNYKYKRRKRVEEVKA